MLPKRHKRKATPPTRPARGRGRTKQTRPATPRQAEILTFVRDYIHKYGYSPTYEEIAGEFDISKVTVFEHLTTLEERGLVYHEKHKARSLQLADHLVLPDQRPSCLRLIGRIAAGSPIEAIEDPEVIDLEQLFGARQGTYLLEVKGDSMTDDHIDDGDYVVVEPRSTPVNGETVVALLDNGEATLKRFYRERGRIRLQPANSKYAPIYTHSARIQGVVVGLIRQT
ncbi:MAG TPA: transcriptional repressor LexA [Phycisphaerae bacterium]|nr:transcriptional repressor LexA [Phycisphaerae bacterium]